MLDLKFIRENPEIVRENMRNKFQEHKLPLVDEVIALDEQNRKNKLEADSLRQNRNTVSKQIGMLMGQGKREEAEEMKRLVNEQAEELKALEEKEAELSKKVLAKENMGARGIIEKSGVSFIGTTDDPIDSLEWHKKIADDKDFKVTVAPSFRPDKALNVDKDGWAEYIEEEFGESIEQSEDENKQD